MENPKHICNGIGSRKILTDGSPALITENTYLPLGERYDCVSQPNCAIVLKVGTPKCLTDLLSMEATAYFPFFSEYHIKLIKKQNMPESDGLRTGHYWNVICAYFG